MAQTELLKEYFQTIRTTPAVIAELQHENTPSRASKWMQNLPTWIEVYSPKLVGCPLLNPPLKLRAGELEAIALAREYEDALLLTDDRDARHYAETIGFRVLGTIGVLQLAAKQERFVFEEALMQLKALGFHLSEKTISKILGSGEP